MFRQVVDRLEEQIYVNVDNVEAIRKYVRIKNPNSSKEELSVIFADAVHKIIDKRIYHFKENDKKKIKEKVLKRAVVKEKFIINAAEVFNVCLSLKTGDDSYVRSFTSWINTNQDVPVSKEKVSKLLDIANQYEEEQIEGNMDNILESFDRGQAVDTDENVGVESIQRSDAEASACAEEYVEEKAAVDIIRRISTFLKEVTANISASLRPSMRIALPLAVPVVLVASLVFMDMLEDNSVASLKPLEQGKYIDIRENQIDRYFSLEPRLLERLGSPHEPGAIALLDELHEELKYTEINKDLLKEWLNKRKSLLSDEPYFTAILDTAKERDIHPLLMFAIAGQEQSFVPRRSSLAGKIANNPFNVYGSWEKYNTNIYDSARLAAGVIINSSRGRPAYMNPIKWINRRYAEDQNWWKNVSSLFKQMKREVMEVDM